MNNAPRLIVIIALLIAVTTIPTVSADPEEIRSPVFSDVSKGSSGSVTGEDWGGLHYDLDTDFNPEKLEWSFDTDGTIEENDLKYSSTPDQVEFEYEGFGTHPSIVVSPFSGEEYVPVEGDTEYNLRLLRDSDERTAVTHPDFQWLERDMALRIDDFDGGKVKWSMMDREMLVESGIADLEDDEDTNDYATYRVDIGPYEEVEVIKVHFDSTFDGETSVAYIDGYYQLSTEVKKPEDFETGVLDDATGGVGESLRMDSNTDIKLGSDTTQELFRNTFRDKLWTFKTSEDPDASYRRYHLVQGLSDNGTLEFRSPVFSDTSAGSSGSVSGEDWSGLHYDLDAEFNPEKLEWEFSSPGGTIEENDLTYSSTPEQVDFEHEGFGTHPQIAVSPFSEDKYVPVNGDTEYNLKLLRDNDYNLVITPGGGEVKGPGTTMLGDGYTFTVNGIDVEGDKVLWSLSKNESNGTSPAKVASGVVDLGDDEDTNDYATYKVDIGPHQDITVFKVHFDSTFQSVEEGTAIIDGYYQLSTEVKKPEDFETGVLDDATGGVGESLRMDSNTDIKLGSDTTRELFRNTFRDKIWTFRTSKDTDASYRRYHLTQESIQEVATGGSEGAPSSTATDTPTATPAEMREADSTAPSTPTEIAEIPVPTSPGPSAFLTIVGFLAVTRALSAGKRREPGKR